MIVGIGVDLVDIARFERTIERTPRLLERLFSEAERLLKPHSLAARYAAKEALIKALGGSEGVHWTEIEIASAALTAPRMRPMCRPMRYSAVIWATNALVDATATSGPAWV